MSNANDVEAIDLLTKYRTMYPDIVRSGNYMTMEEVYGAINEVRLYETILQNFNTQNNITKVLDVGGAIVPDLASEDGLCSSLFVSIQFVKHLGGSENAGIWEIEFLGSGKNKYVGKVLPLTDIDETEVISKTILADQASLISDTYNIPVEFVIQINGGDPLKEYKKGDRLLIPLYATTCRTSVPLQIERFDRQIIIEYPIGSYICRDTNYPEYAIGVLCGNLTRDGICPHFVQTLHFSTCLRDSNQFIFMEMVGKTLKEYGDYSPDLLIQILHAISTYQSHYNVSHNDLHTSNIFVKQLDDTTTYRGDVLSDFDNFVYEMDDHDIYIPNRGAIVKIGDWGLACKWKQPFIGSKVVLSAEYDTRGVGPWIPNWWAPQYDTLYIVTRFFAENPRDSVIRKITAFCLNMGGGASIKELERGVKELNSVVGRPKLLNLEDYTHATAENILNNKYLMSDFLTKPTGSVKVL